MPPTRIAMWSGPRNISSALMRSFDSRNDTYVSDEPLYAFYLDQTGLDHPGRDEVIAHHEADWRKVVDWLTGPVPGDKPIWYQKMMSHHILMDIDTSWFKQLKHAFLIRDPQDMLTSLTKVLPEVDVEQTGLPSQVEIFDLITEQTGQEPPVLDARDVRLDPEGVLKQLCEVMDIPWDPAMLSWEPGARPTDGIWAKHWYANVEKSTAFAPWVEKGEAVPDELRGVLDECQKLYDHMSAKRLTTPACL